MTLIECFTNSHIDNIAACLRLRPEKLVLVGKIEEMRQPCERYKKLLEKRGQKTEVTLRDVTAKDFADICAVLMNIVREEKDCIIDLTGGDEPVIMAVGGLLMGLDESVRSRIRVEKYDRKIGSVIDCIHDNRPVSYDRVDLTVDEFIELHGGITREGGYQPPKSGGRREVDKLWEMASRDTKAWNRTVSWLNEFESRSDSDLQVYLPLGHIRHGIADFDKKEAAVRDLLAEFSRYGVIDDQSSRNSLEYTYRSRLLHHCTRKEGNILEVKTLLESRDVQEKGRAYFGDCRMSVDIDWDGTWHQPEERTPDTHNEIDVMVMHGMTPLFISCKNGNVDEELYKLNTVAERFGGLYARKMLIVSELERKGKAASRAMAQRARDMGIYLVTDAADLGPEEWQGIFKEAIVKGYQ